MSYRSQRRLECSLATLCRTVETALMAVVVVQTAYSKWEINPWWAKFIKTWIECQCLPNLFLCVIARVNNEHCYLEIYSQRRGVCKCREEACAANCLASSKAAYPCVCGSTQYVLLLWPGLINAYTNFYFRYTGAINIHFHTSFSSIVCLHLIVAVFSDCICK